MTSWREIESSRDSGVTTCIFLRQNVSNYSLMFATLFREAYSCVLIRDEYSCVSQYRTSDRSAGVVAVKIRHKLQFQVKIPETDEIL